MAALRQSLLAFLIPFLDNHKRRLSRVSRHFKLPDLRSWIRAMAIAATCPICKRTKNVPDAAAGKMVRCKACDLQFAVPPLQRPSEELSEPNADMTSRSQDSICTSAEREERPALSLPMKNAEWFVLSKGQHKTGPFSTEDMQTYAAAGAIGPEDMVCNKQDTWRKASDFWFLRATAPADARGRVPRRPTNNGTAAQRQTVVAIAVLGLARFRRRFAKAKRVIVAVAALALVAGMTVALVLKYSAQSESRGAQVAESEPLDAKGTKREASESLSAEALFALAAPGVVTITLKNDDYQTIGAGAGFFLNDDLVHAGDDPRRRSFADYLSKKEGRHVQVGYLVTNYHVIRSAVYAQVAIDGGVKCQFGDVVTEDESTDLALLSVYVFSPSLTRLPLAEKTPSVGVPVFAIGNPLGLANSLSPGIVSGIREIRPGISWLQTTAPISPGSSGGPLLNSAGKIVGITTAGLSHGQNLNFAVPVSELRRLLTLPYRTRYLSKGRSIQAEEDDAFISVPLGVQFGMDDLDNGAILSKARDQIAKSNYEDAIATLEGAKRSVPSEFKYLHYFLLGKAHLYLASKAFPSVPTRTVEEWFATFRDSVHGRSALESLTEAQRLNPTFAPTFKSLYTFHAVADQWREGLRAADSLVKLLPQCADAYLFRGRCYYHLDRYDSALADFRESLELNPRDANTHFDLGNVWIVLGEYEKAIESLKEAVSLGFNPPGSCHYGIGNAYQKAGKYQLAIAAYETARTHGLPAALCDKEIAICRKLMR